MTLPEMDHIARADYGMDVARHRDAAQKAHESAQRLAEQAVFADPVDLDAGAVRNQQGVPQVPAGGMRRADQHILAGGRQVGFQLPGGQAQDGPCQGLGKTGGLQG